MDRLRVLFVEGDDPTAATARDVADGDRRFEVEPVEGLSEAERGVAAYDCVVCNYELAGTDGVELASELVEARPSLPVVLYTAVGDETVARDALRAGAADYVASGGVGGQRTGSAAGPDEEAAVLARRVEAAVADAGTGDGDETAAKLETLTRILTHDVRNDLSVVVGWADVLRDSVTEDGEAALERVLDSARHTLELTDVARDAVEAIGGDGADDVGPTDLGPALRRAVRTRQETFPDAAVERGPVPEGRVVANSSLDAVFRTLLNEALSHHRNGDPPVRISAERDGDAVRVRVDDGSAAADARRESAFDGTELDDGDPTVGVFLVKTLVDAYGGAVRVEDGGAAFVVELRAVD